MTTATVARTHIRSESEHVDQDQVKARKIKSLLRKARLKAKETFGEIKRLKLRLAFEIGELISQALTISVETKDYSVINEFAYTIGYGMQPKHMQFCLRLFALCGDTEGRKLLSTMIHRGIGFSGLYPLLEQDIPNDIATKLLKEVAGGNLKVRDIPNHLTKYPSNKERQAQVKVQFSYPRRRYGVIRTLAERLNVSNHEACSLVMSEALDMGATDLYTRIKHRLTG